MVIDNVKREHFKWLTEMAKTLQFKVVEVELTEDEEDAYLLAAMEEGKDQDAHFLTWRPKNLKPGLNPP